VLQGNLPISDEQVDILSAMGPVLSLTNTADPIQADLYFKSAAEYGKWRILCSRPCLRDLARDGTQSHPVLKRLEYVIVDFLEQWADTKEDVFFTGSFRRDIFLKRTKRS
jgi:hypothetical protein